MRLGFWFLFATIAAQPLQSYSVLSHEEIIDIVWESDIHPALMKRFPETTPEELGRAHAFAYGGALIQDLGYYPFGDHEFTYLVHYVRSGDFVSWMLRDAQNVDEFSFALGALSHYAADCWGHPAVNSSVPIEYPKLRKRFGEFVTYEDDPEAHLKTEFSFDVVQVAKRRYISKQYHDFIGYKVAEELLKRAFLDTYGIPMTDIVHADTLAFETYRFSIAHVIPEMTQVALAYRKQNQVQEKPDAARQEFLYHLSRADYEKDFGAKYRRPGIFARILAFILRLIPKFGPFKALQYKDPTPETADLYFRSVDKVIREFHLEIQNVDSLKIQFVNRNLDTGALTQAGRYSLADTTYASLVRRLEHDHFSHLTPALKANILAYFASGPANLSLKPKQWRKTEMALRELKAAAAHPPVTPAGKP